MHVTKIKKTLSILSTKNKKYFDGVILIFNVVIRNEKQKLLTNMFQYFKEVQKMLASH